MRGLLRIVVTLATAVSLALFLVICVLWLRSTFAVDTYPVLTSDDTLVYPMSKNNQFQVLVMGDWQNLPPGAYHGSWNGFRDWGRYAPTTPRPGERGRMPRSWSYLAASVYVWTGDVPGWRTVPDAWNHAMPSWGMVIDYWVPALLTGLLPAAVLFRRASRRIAARRRMRSGLCATCGYDLRASADRCPECGAAAPHGQGVPVTSD